MVVYGVCFGIGSEFSKVNKFPIERERKCFPFGNDQNVCVVVVSPAGAPLFK